MIDVYMKPCNEFGISNDEQTETERCGKSRFMCCAYCKQIKSCLKKWDEYNRSILPRKDKDKIIFCSIHKTSLWCSSVRDFFKAHPKWNPKTIRPEKVEFT